MAGSRTSYADPARSGLVVVGALVGTGWLALWMWGSSPYGRYLGHEYEPSSPGAWVAALALFLGGWLLMSVAMMLPTTTALLRDFARVVAGRREHRRLEASLVVGFLTTWLATGYLFRVLDTVLHVVVESTAGLERRPNLVAGAVLVGAGLFQLTPLKQRCLTACRSPRAFVYRHWSGQRPAADAFRVGLSYGASCVGCCWALMLVVVALGTVNLAWMLAFAAVMALEKTTVVGRAIVIPAGIALIAAGLVLIL